MKLLDCSINFRDILGKIIVIKDKTIIERMDKKPLDIDSDSILTYCYIDNQAGITFAYLCAYNINNKKKFVEFDKIAKIITILRYDSVTDFEIEIINSNHTGEKILDDYIESIDKHYNNNENIKEFRKYIDIDHLRAREFPDDIRVIVIKEGFQSEEMYVKLWKKENNKIFGKLLNEPFQSLGVHLDDIIELNFLKDDEGKTICFHKCL